MSKSAMTVLQEMGVKVGILPVYECLSQKGPQHQATFEYRCTALGESAIVTARSKKEAKQEAARSVLALLARAGRSVPPPWGLAGSVPPPWGLAGSVPPPWGLAGGEPPAAPPAPQTHRYVALLKEYCEEYRLPAPEYTLVGDAGPPHLRSFTMRVSVGAHSRDATTFNKKAARQAAAEQMYKYLRSCLRTTHDFVEEDALARALDKEMGRYSEGEARVWRPPLGQRLSEYQCGLQLLFPEPERRTAMEALHATAASGQPPEVQLSCAASALGLELQWDEMPSKSGPPFVTVELPHTSPALVHMGRSRDDAAQLMLDYLQLCLIDPPRDPLLLFHERNGNASAASNSAIEEC